MTSNSHAKSSFPHPLKRALESRDLKHVVCRAVRAIVGDMFCSNCGHETGVVNFCPACGAKAMVGDPEATAPSVETLHIKPNAKFVNKKSHDVTVVDGDYKAGTWSFKKGELTSPWGIKTLAISSKTVERIEVLKNGLSISGQGGDLSLAGFFAGGFVGGVVGDVLARGIKQGGSLIRIVFSDGKTLTAIVNGDTMASLYGASL